MDKLRVFLIDPAHMHYALRAAKYAAKVAGTLSKDDSNPALQAAELKQEREAIWAARGLAAALERAKPASRPLNKRRRRA